jgi:hypothetical protein
VGSASSSTLSSLGFLVGGHWRLHRFSDDRQLSTVIEEHIGSRESVRLLDMDYRDTLDACLLSARSSDNGLPMGTSVAVDLIPVLIMVAAWALSIANAWLHHDRWSWAGQFALSVSLQVSSSRFSIGVLGWSSG